MMLKKSSRAKVEYPLFRLYKLDDLMRLTGYSDWHLLKIRDGTKPANPVFRRKCATVLSRTEEELFGKKDTGPNG